MATGRIVLPVTGGFAPDGSGTLNNPATPSPMISSGSQTTNSPKVSAMCLLFDPTTEENWEWAFELPGDYSSGGTLAFIGSTAGTSANQVVWKAGAAIAIPGTTDIDAIVFDTVVTVAWTPSTTQGITTRSSVALTMTNAAANRPIIVFVGRDCDNGSDTNASDAVLWAVTFEYVTT